MAEEFENDFEAEELAVGGDANADFSVEIVDDTPPEDQNRQPPADHEGEVETYSKKVQKRLDQLTYKVNEEKREKDRIAREHAEAIRIAQAIKEENDRLKNTLTWGHQEYTKEASTRIDAELKFAQDKYRKAFEAGDTDGVIEAEEAMANLRDQRRQVENLVPPVPQTALQAPETSVYNTQPAQPAPAPRDYKAEDWAAKNPWFGKDDEMTAFAYGVHERLVKSGVDPTSDEYYGKVDARMREVFPNQFQRTKKTSPVASVGRTTASRTVQLTQSEAAIAKRLGVTLEQYARYKLKEQKING